MDYLVLYHLAPSIQQSNDVERAQSFVPDGIRLGAQKKCSKD